jgi:hypothetical protein
MAKRAAKAKSKPTAVKKKWSPAQLAVQKAGTITGDLVCCLQRVRKTFLRIGQLLVEVRDQKHYAALNHKDLESYAAEHLEMSRPTLYRYIKVYEWVLANHKEWLEKGAKIPEMSKVGRLVWIDQELAKKDLKPDRKATLEALQEKAKAGDLSETEIRAVQRRTNKPKKPTARVLASLRATRKRAVRDGVSARLIEAIDQAIRVAENDLVVETADLHLLDERLGRRCLKSSLSRKSMLA